MSDIAERVAKGVAWMDRRYPDWWRKIDLGSLRMNGVRFCVLGQMNPGDPIAVVDDVIAVGPMHLLGFNATPKNERAMEEYEELRVEWTRVIRQRLETAA